MESKSKTLNETQHSRLIYAIANVLGNHCEVKLTSGASQSGLLRTMKKSEISLATPTAKEPHTQTRIQYSDFVSASFKAVKPLDRFKTDLQISLDADQKVDEIKIRELQPWIDDAPQPTLGLSGGTAWDQFAVNKEKFGVESTWDETLYTTQLDINELTKEQIRTAERISKELEGKAVDDDSELDEEARFSAVLGTGRFTNSQTEVKGDTRKRNKQQSKRKNKNRKTAQSRQDSQQGEIKKPTLTPEKQPVRDILSTYLSSWEPGPPLENETGSWDNSSVSES